jgi:hypothetical protein
MIGMLSCKLRDEGKEKGKCPCDSVSTDHMRLTNMQSGETSCKRRHVWSRTDREIIGPSFSALLESARDKERCDRDHAAHDDSLVGTGGRGTHLVNPQLPAAGRKA